MRILYLSLSYVPSHRASAVQVMWMCEAFAAAGHRIALVAKHGDGSDDPHAFYGVANTFEVVRIPRPAYRGGGLLFAAGMLRRLFADRQGVELVYSRDLIGAAIAVRMGLPTVFEVHGVFDRRWQRALMRDVVAASSFRGLVAISSAMVRELALVELCPPHAPVVVAHSPAPVQVTSEVRAAVGSPPRIGYVGSLYPGRGIELVLQLAARMPQCRFDIAGGADADLARWRASAPPDNVTFRGFVAPAALPAVYRTLDVVLAPYPHRGIYGATRHLDTARYCSPMKVFEYMASGVPMVASDLPVLQEVLAHERNALIAPADDAAAWHAAVARLLDDRALRVALATEAQRELAAFTPAARVERIVDELGLGRAASRRTGTPTATPRTA